MKSVCIKSFILILLCLATLFPFTLLGEGLVSTNATAPTAYVTTPDSANLLSLYESPKQGALILGKYYNGTPLTILEEPSKT